MPGTTTDLSPAFLSTYISAAGTLAPPVTPHTAGRPTGVRGSLGAGGISATPSMTHAPSFAGPIDIALAAPGESGPILPGSPCRWFLPAHGWTSPRRLSTRGWTCNCSQSALWTLGIPNRNLAPGIVSGSATTAKKRFAKISMWSCSPPTVVIPAPSIHRPAWKSTR